MKHSAMLILAVPGADTVVPEAVSAWVGPIEPEGDRAAAPRKASGRRVFVPKNCASDSSTTEGELMRAMGEYKEWSGRMFPTWSEVLEVLQSLGYQKPAGTR